MSDPPERGARERILAAAVDRIATDGIDDMRIARVATQAGVSTSLVHYHFETREALLAEALEYSYELTGDVRIGEGEGEASDHFEQLAGVIDQFLPYPGHLQRDWILYVELWLRAVAPSRSCARPARASTGACANGSRTGSRRASAMDRSRPTRTPCASPIGSSRSPTAIGVRVLIGDLDIEQARREVWAGLADELGLPEAPPPPLGGERAQCQRHNAPLTAPGRRR